MYGMEFPWRRVAHDDHAAFTNRRTAAIQIEEVAKSVETQKAELAEKLEATEKALEVQTAKVEEFAQAGAVKKSVDSEDDEDVQLVKSAPQSFWGNMYLPQGLINSLGYKS